jgi:hypothetical protein
MLTVGAGSVDRHFDAEVEYEPTIVVGETLAQDTRLEGVYPLVYWNYCHYADDVDGMLMCKRSSSECSRRRGRRACYSSTSRNVATPPRSPTTTGTM